MPSVNLPVYAPIPRGHRIRLMELRRSGGFLSSSASVTIVIDLTDDVHYVPHVLMGDLRDWRSVEALDQLLENGRWTATAVFEGEVVASSVFLKGGGDPDPWTRLFLKE